jgi:nucleoside-diphosphate-sugar epimerase
MIANKRVLLTGGAGFIGSSLARRLLPDNDVVVLDTGHRDCLSGSDIAAHPRLEHRVGDVCDPDTVREAMEGCHLVVHLAAIAGVDTVLTMPVRTMQVSLLGTHHVLEAARGNPRIERVIDFSTSEVFGSYAYNVREGDLTSLGAVGEARWTYAVSKLATEHLAHNYHKQYGLPALSVRPFNIYGPGQVGEGAIHRFIVQALHGRTVTVHNDGGQIRAWCYIDDMVAGILLCLERPEAVGQAFNIGNPRSVVTIDDLARRIVRLAESPSEVAYVPWNHPDVELRIPNIDKARRLLGYEPAVGLDDGLARTIAWYRSRMAAGAASH